MSDYPEYDCRCLEAHCRDCFPPSARCDATLTLVKQERDAAKAEIERLDGEALRMAMAE